jgi:hypothetical protein
VLNWYDYHDAALGQTLNAFLKCLFDSNIFIPAEPTTPGDVEAKSRLIIDQARWIAGVLPRESRRE